VLSPGKAARVEARSLVETVSVTTIVSRSRVEAADAAVLRHRVSWGAILAGATAMIAVQLVLNLVGVGVGVSTLDPASGESPSAAALSGGAAAWFVVSGILASVAGGYLAGRLAGGLSRAISGYHGLVAWAVAALLVVYLLTSTVGGLVGGAFNGVSSAVGGLGRTAGGAVQTVAQAAAPSLAQTTNPLGRIERQVRDGLGGQDPAALRDTAVQAVAALVSGDAAQQQQARERAVQALAQAQGVSPDQARQQVAQYEQQYRQTVEETRRKAVEAAEVAARATARAAFVAALAMILGAAAAFFAARAGTRRDAVADLA
jgi:hypothetical protein